MNGPLRTREKRPLTAHAARSCTAAIHRFMNGRCGVNVMQPRGLCCTGPTLTLVHDLWTLVSLTAVLILGIPTQLVTPDARIQKQSIISMSHGTGTVGLIVYACQQQHGPIRTNTTNNSLSACIHYIIRGTIGAKLAMYVCKKIDRLRVVVLESAAKRKGIKLGDPIRPRLKVILSKKISKIQNALRAHAAKSIMRGNQYEEEFGSS